MTKLTLASIYDTVRSLERILGPFPVLILATDCQGRVVMTNSRARDALGRAEVDLLDRPIADFIPGLSLTVERTGADARHADPVVRFGTARRRALRADGPAFPVEVHASAHRLGDDVLCVVALLDMTERLQAERATKESRELLDAILAGLPAMVAAKTSEGTYEFVNAYQGDVFGVAPADAIGRTATDLLGEAAGRSIDTADRRLAGGKTVSHTATETLVDAEGRRRAFITTRTAMRDARGEVQRVLSVGLDVTHATAAEERLERLSLMDGETGLPNRGAMHQILGAQIRSAGRNGQRVGVILLRVANLREIATDIGDGARTVVMRRVAIRLGGLVDDRCVIARFDDETFAVVLPDPEDGPALERESARLAARLGRAVTVERTAIAVRFQTGLAPYPESGGEGEQVLRAAEFALRARIRPANADDRRFAEDIGAYLARRREAATALRLDLERGNLGVLYRPVATLGGDRLVGFESCLADRSGQPMALTGTTAEWVAGDDLAVPLMERMLAEVSRSAARWGTACRVVLPLLAGLIHQSDLVDMVEEAQRRVATAGGRLSLAIDYGDLASDPLAAATTLAELAEIGVDLVLDGFGVGGVPVLEMPRLAFRRVTLAPATVAALPDDPGARTGIPVAIQLAQALGLTVGARGVASPGQHAFLRRSGCETASGPAIGRWHDSAGAEAMMRNRVALAG